ncbi:MAG: hypothetical protein K8I82_10860 [Anaerolineae bacterium]|nr:hypothetical protein [Anaerolineae bacterium]
MRYFWVIPIVFMAVLSLRTQNRQEETVLIAVVTQPVERGTVFTPDMVSGSAPIVDLVEWPVALAPFNTVTNLRDITGRVARADMPSRTPILLTNLVDDFSQTSRIGSDVALFVPEDKVAVPLSLRGVSAGGIQRFSQVEITGIFDFGNEIVTSFVLSGEVLEIGEKNMTVAVTPDDAVMLIWMQDMGIPLMVKN